MKRRIYRIPRKFLFLLTMLYGIAMQAQDVTVSGTVVSADDSMGLPGVNVVVKGTTTGTVTDFDGNYSIVAPSANSTLVFTYIGFTAQEIPINGKTQLDVTMSEDAAALDEVVVVLRTLGLTVELGRELELLILGLLLLIGARLLRIVLG